jgi:signal transduction histidine kinase/CheY-like chemotaxis protein/AraC-like DNA-binding protein
MKKLFFLFLFLYTSPNFAQSKTIKSLQKEIKSVTPIEKKAKLYYELADLYRKNLNVDSAYYFAKKAFDYNKSKNIDSLTVKSALQLYRIANTTIKKDSTDYLTIAQKIAEHSSDKSLLIETNYSKGQVLYLNNEWALAFPEFIKVDSIAKKHSIKNKTTVYAIIQRSEIIRQKFSKETTNQAGELLHEALKMAKEIRSQEMIHLIYTYLADISELNENHEESKRYIDLAYHYYLKKDDIRNLSQVYLLYTSYYIGIDQIDKANQQQIERIKYLRQKEDRLELARALAYYGSFQRRKTKEYNSAIQNLLKAKSIYESIKLTDIDAFERLIFNLSRCYSEIENHEKANVYLKEAYNLREDLIEKENQILTTSLETHYQTEKKEQEIKLLSEVAQKQKFIYLSIVGLLIALGTFLFFGYRNKIKTAAKINELNELKSRFFANISHEFRTPLTLIKSPVQSLQNQISDENQKAKLNLIDQNSDRMHELVDQLLELSKLDNGKLKLILKEGNLANFLNSIVEAYQFKAKENNQFFTSNIQHNANNHLFDKDVVQKIVTNLLSNAFKYTTEKEKISFSSTIENNQLKLVVSNSGSEIKKEEVSKLFERFYQKKESQQGVGIGLALIKELVELYNGKIETIIENRILSFIVILPIESAPINILNEEKTIETNELPIVLIVDDNQDVRELLKDLFKPNFQILEAKDGEQALDIALKEVPDCIISDVMMPKMDGFEFTKAIKTNELTSFIPVVLLTAKVSDEDHLQGLKSTADAYLTKPFNNDIVKETVNQLIAEREKLHKRYSQELVLKPTDIVINSVDEKFIEKLQIILNKEIANADFSADNFASEMNMSRMQLHRKLKSLLGVSSTEFLRKERLKMAAQLFEKGNGTISEIIYSVGFNDVSYFNRCFKEMYHCTPSEYQNKS